MGPPPTRRVSFGVATAAMKAGKRMRRTGWNGKGMWVRYVDFYVDKEFQLHEAPDSQGTWLPFLAMKTADGKLVPWLASQSDMLADDWEEATDGLHLHRPR